MMRVGSGRSLTQFDRRSALKTLGCHALVLPASMSSAFARTGGRKAVFRNGLCASEFAAPLLDGHVSFSDGKRVATNLLTLQRLMMAHGSNEIFVRMGSGGGADGKGFLSAMRRAALAKAVGLPLNPELLLCARYGDMGGQPEPDFSAYPTIKLSGAWHQLCLDEMRSAVREYAAITARRIVASGAEINVWDIGNEVEFGIAGVALPPMVPTIGGPGWQYRAPDRVDPEIGKMTLGRFLALSTDDQVAWGKAHLWNHVGSILAAAAEGIRSVVPSARFATHTSTVAAMMPEVFVGFHEAVEASGFNAEALGMSFYPTSTSRIEARYEKFKEATIRASSRVGKPVYIAEYAYAAGPVTYGGENWANPIEGYPCTPEGQARFTHDIVAWGVGKNLLSGIRPWAPDYVDGSWQGMALFDRSDRGRSLARPALSVIASASRKAL